MKTLFLTITGRVQGVYFRASARQEARKLGITGLARNQSDGSVTIIAQGEGPALDMFIAWCHHGPAMARVASVEVKNPDNVERFTDFVIA